LNTPRERITAVLLLGAILLAAGGFFAYQLILSPLQQKTKALANLHRDVSERQEKQLQLTNDLRRLTPMRRLSLPSDLELARREYAKEINKLGRQAEFSVGSFHVTPKPVENRQQLPASKRPPFTRLQFDVQAHGDIAALVDFLERFYRTPLLHRVKTMQVQKPATPRQHPDDLDVNLSLEAVILDAATLDKEEKDLLARKQLLPENVEPLPRLARPSAQYASIAGRNIFLGPPPKQRDERPPREPILELVELNDITHNEKGASATLTDPLNNLLYKISSRADGPGYRVEQFYFIKDRPRKMPLSGAGGRELAIQDEYGEIAKRYDVVRIDATGLILKDKDKHYVLTVGRHLSEVKELKGDQLKALGLDGKEEKVSTSSGSTGKK
jgi:hypothetical protein